MGNNVNHFKVGTVSNLFGNSNMKKMDTKIKIAFSCYFVVGLFWTIVGIVYLFSPKIMTYHQRVIGVGWNDLDPGFQTMILMLLKGTGLGDLVTGIAMGILLLIPFRRGEKWVRWALPLIGLSSLLPTAGGALFLSISTGTWTPWPVLVVANVIIVAGFFFSKNLTPL